MENKILLTYLVKVKKRRKCKFILHNYKYFHTDGQIAEGYVVMVVTIYCGSEFTTVIMYK